VGFSVETSKKARKDGEEAGIENEISKQLYKNKLTPARPDYLLLGLLWGGGVAVYLLSPWGSRAVTEIETR